MFTVPIKGTADHRLFAKWTIRLTTVISKLINKNTSIYLLWLYSNDS